MKQQQKQQQKTKQQPNIAISPTNHYNNYSIKNANQLNGSGNRNNNEIYDTGRLEMIQTTQPLINNIGERDMNEHSLSNSCQLTTTTEQL